MGDDRETRWLREMWRAFGCAGNPNDFKASVRDDMWARMVEWATERSAQELRAYESGRCAGYQDGLMAATTASPTHCGAPFPGPRGTVAVCSREPGHPPRIADGVGHAEV